MVLISVRYVVDVMFVTFRRSRFTSYSAFTYLIMMKMVTRFSFFLEYILYSFYSILLKQLPFQALILSFEDLRMTEKLGSNATIFLEYKVLLVYTTSD